MNTPQTILPVSPVFIPPSANNTLPIQTGNITNHKTNIPDIYSSGNLSFTLPTLPSMSHHATPQAKETQAVSAKTRVQQVLAPSLELVTAATFLLHMPKLQAAIQRLYQAAAKKLDKPVHPQNSKHVANVLKRNENTFNTLLKKISNPRLSNILLASTILLRAAFNSSIGINQQQPGMVTANIAAVLTNIPLIFLMERAIHKHGPSAAGKYSKILTLANLMLTGLFTTGFVQKARHDIGQTHYNHDMRNLKETFDFKNSLSPNARLKRSMHEAKQMGIDSLKAYGKAWGELTGMFQSKERFQAFLNPLKPEGTPARVAFSAFTMPLGALIALLNIKNNRGIAIVAALTSILGNAENGLALALSSWLDKDQPLRWLGILGGLTSPISEGILTSRHAVGPATMTTSNAFQNLYQATAWAHPNESQTDKNLPKQNIMLNEGTLLPPPQ